MRGEGTETAYTTRFEKRGFGPRVAAFVIYF